MFYVANPLQREENPMKAYTKYPDFNSSSSEMLCKKHPNSSSVGICAYCLRERLAKLSCSDCGENRCSSCSCSYTPSSYRNSCSKLEIGRMSMLIENEKTDNPHSLSRRKDDVSDKFILVRRSSSSYVEMKKRNGFWKIKTLFRKRGRNNKGCGENSEFCDESSEIWASDIMGVSKSRSLCSLRGGTHNDVDELSDCGKISDVSSGIFFDSDKHSESRRSGLIRDSLSESGVFLRNQVRESDFSKMDESAFIDLKLDSLSEFKGDFTVVERGLRRGNRSQNVWKWFLKYNSAAAKEEK